MGQDGRWDGGRDREADELHIATYLSMLSRSGGTTRKYRAEVPPT